MKELTDEQAKAAASQPTYVAPKTLDSIMKLDKMKDLNVEEITDIWKKFQTPRSSVFAVISDKYWSYIFAMKTHLPMFVYPIPRDNGKWLFYVGSWGGNELNFTALELYKLKGAEAPVMLTLCHYPDLVG